MDWEKFGSGLLVVLVGVALLLSPSFMPEGFGGGLVALGWFTVVMGLLISVWGYLALG